MLGYWPEGSLCAIFTDAQRRVALIMRWDADAALPVLPPSAAGIGPHDAVPLESVHLVAYTAPPEPSEPPVAPHRSAWGHAEAALRGCGSSLGWILVAARHGDNVPWTFVEGDAGDLDVRVISAAEIAQRARRWGLPPWSATRDEYVGDIATDPAARERVVKVMRTLTPVVEASRDDAIDVAHDLLACATVTDTSLAQALVALADVRVRDTLLWDLMHEAPSTWAATGERLARMVAVAPDTHVAGPATLLAILRWQVGDGSRASAAVERALAADPTYTLAALVDRCLATGMHPAMWRAGLADLSREACRRAA